MSHLRQKGQLQTEIFPQVTWSDDRNGAFLNTLENVKDAYFHCVVLVAMLTSLYTALQMAQIKAESYSCSKLKKIKKSLYALSSCSPACLR